MLCGQTDRQTDRDQEDGVVFTVPDENAAKMSDHHYKSLLRIFNSKKQDPLLKACSQNL